MSDDAVVNTDYGAKIKSKAVYNESEFDFQKLDSPNSEFWNQLMLCHQHYETNYSVSGDVRNGILNNLKKATEEIQQERDKFISELNSHIERIKNLINQSHKQKLQPIIASINNILPRCDNIKDINKKGIIPTMSEVNIDEVEIEKVSLGDFNLGSFTLEYMAKFYEKDMG